MHIPLSYSIRNLRTRRLTTTLTVSGMALVVFVFATILMLAQGLQKTLVTTGSDDNVVVIRKGAGAEVMSGVGRAEAAIVEMLPEAAIGSNGERMAAKEVVVLMALTKKGTNRPSNVTLRGVGDKSLELRPQIRLIQGRPPRKASSEIMVGSAIAQKFVGVELYQMLRFGIRDWQIVGIFNAENTGFDSEIWGDIDQFMQAFRRPVYSSVIFKLRRSSEFDTAKANIESDPRLTLEAKRETRYYLDQSEMMAKFLRILGVSLTLIFSIGAIIGAMITMYSAVSSRIAEIGTLRALGFRRMDILVAFLAESAFLGLFGGALGLFGASFMQFITVSTVNFNTFSELAFSFALNSNIIVLSLLFSVMMGLIGGLLPAIRAFRLNIVDSLRSA